MGIKYEYNAGYGFLLPLDKFALPAMWDDREVWQDGTIDKELDGSGMTAVLGGSHMTGDELWGFVAQDTCTRMSRYSGIYEEIRDIDPTVVGNLFDIRARVKRPNARIGWMMWADIS